MSINTHRVTKGQKMNHTRNLTYFRHECPICHEIYTNHRKTGTHCGRSACKRIYKLEQQRDASTNANHPPN